MPPEILMKDLAHLLSGGWSELQSLERPSCPCPLTVQSSLEEREIELACSSKDAISLDPTTLTIFNHYMQNKIRPARSLKLCRDILVGTLHNAYGVKASELCGLFGLGRKQILRIIKASKSMSTANIVKFAAQFEAAPTIDKI